MSYAVNYTAAAIALDAVGQQGETHMLNVGVLVASVAVCFMLLLEWRYRRRFAALAAFPAALLRSRARGRLPDGTREDCSSDETRAAARQS